MLRNVTSTPQKAAGAEHGSLLIGVLGHGAAPFVKGL